MPLPPLILRLRKAMLSVARKLAPLPPLLARIAVGVTFLASGWGKVHDLSKITDFFTELHIPWPHFNAVLASGAELVCGALLLVGLLTRFAAVPLVIVMMVAIGTAKWEDVSGVKDLLGLEELTYIVVFLWLAIAGPGPISIDHLLRRWLIGNEPEVAS
jgi:putative oxidoreductase